MTKATQIDEFALRSAYAVEGLSSSACAKLFGCSPQTVLNRLKKLGVKAHANGAGTIEKECVDCGKPFSIFTSLSENKTRCPACRGVNRWGKQDRTTLCTCAECGAELKRLPSRISAGVKTFCGKKCQNTWQSKNVFGENHPQWTGGEAAKRARVESDPAKKLRSRVSNQIWWSLRDKKAGRRWESIVGYDVHALMAHLASKFQAGMSWENYGKWHIDHMIPVVAFEFESEEDDQFKKCFSLNNLQPLWARDNMSKGTKILPYYGVSNG